MKQLTTVAVACLIFASCKKDLKDPLNLNSGDTNMSNSSSARVSLNGDYSRISYDASRGYLVFPNQETFQAAVNSLEDEVSNFQYDQGQTAALLALINNSNTVGTVKNELIAKSPLSDEVLIAFMNKGFPLTMIKEVLFENIHFSEQVEEAYMNLDLPTGIRNQINEERLNNISLNNPVLSAFESKFHNYTSLRKETLDATNQFLKTGGDAESPLNPKNKFNAASDAMSALLNKYGEVKVGNDVYISLEMGDIKVAGGSASIVNYIRNTGTFPKTAIPASEPANGLPKSSNPAPIDPAITVEPNAFYNLNCGGVEINQENLSSQRYSFGVRNKETKDLSYYWDFGDGFVSYKQFPEHQYTDGVATHNVTVTVYNSLGVNCNPPGSGATITQTNCTYTGVLYALTGAGTYNINFQAEVFGAPQPATYQWDFGDGGFAFGGNDNTISHSYSTYGTYNANVTVTDATGCQSVFSVTVNIQPVSSSNGPNNPVVVTQDCDARDKDKSGWKYTPDGNRRFETRFKLKNFLGLIDSKLVASIETQRKDLLGIWWPEKTNQDINMYGTVYYATNDGPCEGSVEITQPGPTTSSFDYDNKSEIVHTIEPPTHIYKVAPNSMHSKGGAYGLYIILNLD